MIVDLAAIRRNCEKVAATVTGRTVIPVIKANAYGYGADRVAPVVLSALGTDLIACGHLLEGIEIRNVIGDKADIMIFVPLQPWQLEEALLHRLQPTVCTPEHVRSIDAAAAKCGVMAEIQLKIETGMNRIGARLGAELGEVLAELKRARHVTLAGVYTHFSTATDRGEPFVPVQNELYHRALLQIDQSGFAPRYKHCCNTGALSWLEDNVSTHVRTGCALLGLPSMDDWSNPMDVEPCATWRAYITQLRLLQAGESTGYGMFYTAEKPTLTATVNVGYADGVSLRRMQTGGPVIVNDSRTVFLAGCMDQSIIDVTDIDCRPGDPVTIFGYSPGGELLTQSELHRFTGESLVIHSVATGSRTQRIYI